MNIDKTLSPDNPHLTALYFCRLQDKLSTDLDQETIILDLESGIYSQLNPVASTIWKLLEIPVSFETIVNEVVSTYDVTKDSCTDEIISFLADLAENQLINIANDAPA